MQVVLELLHSRTVWRSTVDTFQKGGQPPQIFGYNRPLERGQSGKSFRLKKFDHAAKFGCCLSYCMAVSLWGGGAPNIFEPWGSVP